MKYVLAATLVCACVATVRGQESDASVAEPQEYTTEQKAAAKDSRERFLEKLRGEIADCQKRLSTSRSAVDSEERQILKNAVAEKKQEFAEALSHPVSHWLKQAEIDRAVKKKDAAQAIEDMKAAQQKDAASRERIRKERPLSIEGLGLHRNLINLPQLVVLCKNNSDQRIEAYTVNAECFNKFDEPVNSIAGTNVYTGISQTVIQSGQEGKSSWQMSLHGATAYAKVWITRVRFADGTEWNQTRQEAKAKGKAIFRIDMD